MNTGKRSRRNLSARTSVRSALTLRSAASLVSIAAVPEIAPDEIHVWAFELAASAEHMQLCREFLSAAELENAARFVFERHRDAYLISHGVLRALLGAYTRRAPASLLWINGPNGKPSLPDDMAIPLSFNLSHSGTRALLAVSNGPEVGADLEQHRPIEAASIAERFFFGSEREAIRAAPDPNAAFFRYWTAKEAVMKGCGAGLALPLDEFAVVFQDEVSAHARVETRNPAVLSDDWTVQSIDIDHGWSAAVAARGNAWRVVPQGEN
jgi:4'-phosphopantetheinyl transferase